MTESSAKERNSILPPNIADDLAFHDELTGLYNRRVLELIRRDHWTELTEGRAVSLVIMDLDLFKQVNDAYGHLAGDAVLVATADALRHSFRRDDILIRYGGDEFLVLLPGASEEESETLAERARTALSSQVHFADDDGDGEGDRRISLPISFSIGRATYPTDGTTPRALLAAADTRMYRDKRRRRPAVSKRSRIALLLGVTLLLLLTAFVARLISQSQTNELPSIVEPPPSAAPLGASDDTASLRVEIAQLENLVATLRAELDRDSAAPDLEVDARIAQLEETISRLHDELETSISNDDPRQPLDSSLQDVEAPASINPDREASGSSETPRQALVTGGSEDEPRESAPSRQHQTVLKPPELLHLEPPVYPQKARELRREATVELEVVVGADGRVVSVRPLGEPAGLGFDAAARRAAAAALYQPGLRDGVPTETIARLLIQFTLER